MKVRKFIPIGLVVISTVIAVLIGELVVRFVVNPGDFLFATMIEDPILRHRIKPYSTGHDALGLRNAEMPERSNFIAIGDSQTYGDSAPRNGSWPHQLGELLHEPVYNMGLGGYGPLQYLYLAQHEARKFKPKQLVVAFYFGNDLVDAYSLAHNAPYWNSWRGGNAVENDASVEQKSAGVAQKKLFAGLRDWLSRHSVLYSMARVTLLPRLASWEQDRIALQMPPDQRAIWIDPNQDSVRTIFTPQIRLSAMDLRQPKIQEGLRITKRAFATLQQDADAQGTKLLIALIPTKERVYCRYLKDSGWHLPGAFANLCDTEEQIKKDLALFFATEHIAYVDVTEAMEAQSYQHIQLYPKDSDGHPLAAGYGVIAHTIYDAIQHQRNKK